MVLYLGACTGWQVQPVAPAQFVADEQPSQIRVTTADTHTLVLKNPIVRNDSILGRASGQMKGAPLGEVRQVETLKIQVDRTVMLVVGFAAAIGMAAVVANADYVGDSWGSP
jgi:hypothetical protein